MKEEEKRNECNRYFNFLFLNFPASNALNLFIPFNKFQPRCSYKVFSYKKV